MSRLARGEAYHVAEYLLKECGVRVELVREKFTPDLAGHVNKQMTILMDGMYPKMVSQWTKTKMQQMVERGYWCGVLPSLGYRKEVVTDAGGFTRGDKEPPKRLVVHAEEAEIVRYAYDLYREKHSLAVVRDYLKTVTGRPWTTTNTKRLLSNEVFLGVQVFGEWRNEQAHEAIIERQTWETVQASLASKAGCRPPRTDAYTYYLRGLIYCPHCGCSYSLYSAKSGKVRYYSCLHNQKRKTCCPVKWVNADALHYTVLHAINRAAKHETVMHKLLAQSSGDSGSDRLSSDRQRGSGGLVGGD